MPTEIVTETCPAPECNLSEKDIEQCLDEMTDDSEMFEPAFQRVEQLERSKVYLLDLLPFFPTLRCNTNPSIDFYSSYGDEDRNLHVFAIKLCSTYSSCQG